MSKPSQDAVTYAVVAAFWFVVGFVLGKIMH
jgi:hypothetical protein